MSKKLGKADIDDEVISRSTPQVPMGRAGSPEDVAEAVAFLASEGASYISGQSIIAAPAMAARCNSGGLRPPSGFGGAANCFRSF